MESSKSRSALDKSDSNQNNLNLRYLQAELTRIDILIHREVQRWQLAGQDPQDTFRGLYVSDIEAEELLRRPFCSDWGKTVGYQSSTEEEFARVYREAELQVQALEEICRCQGHGTKLSQLASSFNLNRFEIDTLLICLAPNFDLRYERLYGYLQDDVTRKRPSVNLVLNLLSQAGPQRLLLLSHYSDNAPLIKFGILERIIDNGLRKQSLLSQSLQVDQTVINWLLGSYLPHGLLSGEVDFIQKDLNSLDDLIREIRPLSLGSIIEGSPILVFNGPDRLSHDSIAKTIAAQENRSIVKVDLASLVSKDVSSEHAIRVSLRDARLTNSIPYLTGWDSVLFDGEVNSVIIAELCDYSDTIIISGQSLWRARGVTKDRIFLWFSFPIPTYTQRMLLWQFFLDRVVPKVAWNLNGLAGQFQLNTGQIQDAVASAKNAALQRNEPLKLEDLFSSARSHSNPRLSNLARKIVPRYHWMDIVLPDDQIELLQEIVATVRGRSKVLDMWEVGKKLVSSRGVTTLFSGPPGTGKTMAAEIIANELRLDLFKIDLSTVVSKYIGETEKNLERIFNEAEMSNAILFFDEADALFGKRSEVRDSHDRFANIEISYLLQRMEAYNGVTFLATNLRANLDEAFTRRLQFAVDFPFPEQADRLRIWKTLFPKKVPRVEGLDFYTLSRRFRLAGGNIRNIIVNAAYLAADDGQVVTMDHILHGTRRELQKMGRLIADEDLTI